MRRWNDPQPRPPTQRRMRVRTSSPDPIGEIVAGLRAQAAKRRAPRWRASPFQCWIVLQRLLWGWVDDNGTAHAPFTRAFVYGPRDPAFDASIYGMPPYFVAAIAMVWQGLVVARPYCPRPNAYKIFSRLARHTEYELTPVNSTSPPWDALTFEREDELRKAYHAAMSPGDGVAWPRYEALHVAAPLHLWLLNELHFDHVGRPFVPRRRGPTLGPANGRNCRNDAVLLTESLLPPRVMTRPDIVLDGAPVIPIEPLTVAPEPHTPAVATNVVTPESLVATNVATQATDPQVG